MSRRFIVLAVLVTMGCVAASVQASPVSFVSQQAHVLACAAHSAQTQISQTTVWYVDKNATGQDNGTSWGDAWTDLQSALATGSGVSSGHEVWVAAATYKPTTGTTRTSTFTLKNGVKIYGGFAGGETSLSQQDPVNNVTILNGEIGGGSSSDNCYHVVTASSVDQNTRLDGFTVTAG